jgi:hypothetical protein
MRDWPGFEFSISKLGENERWDGLVFFQASQERFSAKARASAKDPPAATRSALKPLFDPRIDQRRERINLTADEGRADDQGNKYCDNLWNER